MRTAFAFFVVFNSIALSAFGQPFRIATWQVPDLVAPRSATNAPPADPTQAQDIAATLSTAEADAIILYGISDGQTLKQIGDMMKPRKYSVAHHTVFRHGGTKGPIVGEPFAILAPRQRLHAKNFEWADTGRIDFPGGFAFATFRHGNSTVAVYVAGLPGSLTNGFSSTDNDYLSRKRDYAAQYLAAHIGWLATTYTNQTFATYLTGDINPGAKRALRDDAAMLLEKAGFRALLLGAVADKSAHSVTNSRHLDRVLDPVFTKNVEFIASRQIALPPPEHPMVICELTLKTSGVAAVAPIKRSSSGSKPSSTRPPAPAPEPPPAVITAAPARTPAAAQANAPVSSIASSASNTSNVVSPSPLATTLAPAPGTILNERWFWPAVGGTAAVLTALVLLGIRTGRRRNVSLAVSRRPGDALFVEMKPAVVSEATTSTDNSHNPLWPAPPVQVRTQEHADPARAGLMPHLRRLMREKLFLWLSHQRTHLIDSHETGTLQVLGLEERLEKIKNQFQDRLITQEQRIAELDHELQAKERILKEKSKPENQQSNMG